MSYTYRQKSLDLSTARSQNEPEKIASDVCEIAVESVDSEAFLHLGDKGADPIRAIPELVVDVAAAVDGGLGDVYVSNPSGGGGQIVVQATDGVCLEYGGGGAGSAGPWSLSPERLPSPLGAGDALNAGNSPSIERDVAGADRARVRAEVSGMTSLVTSNVETASPWSGEDLAHMAADFDRARIWLANSSSGEVHEVDVADPDNPVVLISFTPDLSGSAIDRATGVAYDPQNDLLLVNGENSGVPESGVMVLDVSTRGTISQSGDVVTQSSGRNVEDRIAVYGPESLAFANREDGVGFDVVDYSSPNNPTVQNTITNDFAGGNSTPRVDVDAGYLLYHHEDGNNDASLTIWEVDTGTVLFLDTLTYQNQNVSGNEERMEIDPVRGYGWAGSPNFSDERTILFSYDGQGLTIEDRTPFEFLSDRHRLDAISYDPVDELLWGVNFWDAEGHVFDVSDPFNPVLLGTVSQPERKTARFWPEKFTIFSIGGSEDLDTHSLDPGEIELRIFTLNPNGNRNSAPAVVSAGIDDEEIRADLDLVGEARVDVELANVGSQNGTIQYVDLYREAL